MIGGRSDHKVVLVTGPIDFRSGINKLAALVSDALRRDPYCGDVFVFRSKRRMDRLKLIHFDGSGMILATKWLEAGKFVWPPIRDGVITLTSAQMTLLIGGMDWTRLQEIPVKKPEMAG
jgi:transposase